MSSTFFFSPFFAVHSLGHTGLHLSDLEAGNLASESARVGGSVIVAYDSVSQVRAGGKGAGGSL